MTVLIGLLCKDGIVVGTDSSATLGGQYNNQRFSTVEQKTQKIEIINGDIILAGTGSGGLSQRFSNVIQSYSNNGNLQSKDHHQIVKDLCIHGINNFTQTGLNIGGFDYGSLLAFVSQDKMHLCEFQLGNLQPEFKTKDLWYVSMGSGQSIADPFLGFLRDIFWEDEQPTIEEGIFFVLWTLHQAIKLNTGGINGPESVAILAKEDSGYVAKTLTDDDIDEHKENIEGIKQHLLQYELLKEPEFSDIPEPPIKPKSEKQTISST